MESVVKGVVTGGSAAECQKIITFLQGEPQVMSLRASIQVLTSLSVSDC